MANTVTCIVFLDGWPRILWPTFVVANFRPCILFRDFDVSHERRAKKNRLEKLNWQSSQSKSVAKRGQTRSNLLTGKSFCQQIWPHFSILSQKSRLIHVADDTRSKSWPRILSRRGWLSRKNNTSYSVTLQSLQCLKSNHLITIANAT